MDRHSFLVSMLSFTSSFVLTPLMGCNVNKKNIRNFDETFTYLKDPEFRQKEKGNALLVVEQATFSGEQFDEQVWDNIRFVDCDFIGAYEIRLDALRHCRFEGCRFTGVIGWGTTEHVVFTNCQVTGDSNISGNVGSKNVRFENCTFQGLGADPNQWGTMGTYGEAEYVKCDVKWFSVFGFDKLILRDCTIEDGRVRTDSQANSGQDYQQSAVLIERGKLRGTFKMIATHLQSLTIRDTVLDNLDLTNATINGDVLMERVRGGSVNGWIRGAPRVTIRSSQFTPSPGFEFVFELVSADTQQALIENVQISGGMKAVNFGFGALGSEAKKVAPTINQSFVIVGSRISRVDASYLNSAEVRFERNTFDSLDLSNSRIGKLEISGNTIARSVDFTNTQVEESKVQVLAQGQAKLNGSNIKTN